MIIFQIYAQCLMLLIETLLYFVFPFCLSVVLKFGCLCLRYRPSDMAGSDPVLIIRLTNRKEGDGKSSRRVIFPCSSPRPC